MWLQLQILSNSTERQQFPGKTQENHPCDFPGSSTHVSFFSPHCMDYPGVCFYVLPPVCRETLLVTCATSYLAVQIWTLDTLIFPNLPSSNSFPSSCLVIHQTISGLISKISAVLFVSISTALGQLPLCLLRQMQHSGPHSPLLYRIARVKCEWASISLLLFFFLQWWELNPGPQVCQANALALGWAPQSKN